ncbi:MAG: family 16 glycoside hydrolase, partial [Planctomycetota bacterium]
FAVESTYAPGELLADAAVAARFDAFVLDYNGPAWGEAAQENFLHRIRTGAGAVVVHAANNSGKDWPEYERLVGDLWREGTGHGRFHSFDVDVVDRDHPVTRSLPRIVQHPDELYHRLVRVEGTEHRTLMSAFSEPETGGTGEREPMVLVGLYGKGRVFHTPLGHVWPGVVPSQASHRDPQFQGLIVRGTDWAIDGKVDDEERAPAALTEAEIATGIRPLADWWAASTPGRIGRSRTAPQQWTIQGGTLHTESGSERIVSQERFGDFVLEFEWKGAIASAATLTYRTSTGAVLQYALTDAWADAGTAPLLRTGAIRGLSPAAETPAPIWGEYRRGRVVVRGAKVEHWLDGVLVASATVEGDEWHAALVAAAESGYGEQGKAEPGRFVIDPAGSELWLRAVRALSFDPAPAPPRFTDGGPRPPAPRPLFDSADLAESWTNVGDATYAHTDDTLVGNAGPERKQSFLVSRAEYGDFELEVDVKIATLGNSGIQLRSRVVEGRLRGYQAEIDPTTRAWSGGIYDEGRRGWLNDLSVNPEARNAFDLDGWNRYRIVCDGPHIRTWVNDVPAADLLDGADLAGSLAFQIHGGDDDIEIHWRKARIVERGRHAWRPRVALKGGEAGAALDGADGLRTRVLGEGSRVRVALEGDAEDAAVDPTADQRWHAGGRNELTLLAAEGRWVVQLNDWTILRGNGTPTGLTVDGAEKVGGWQRCR